jgi:L-aspartate oxidase
MGGIAVDEWGRASLARLWACGETSATGVHGANRLASNSLLEALVYGSRVATNIANSASTPKGRPTSHMPDVPVRGIGGQAVSDLRNVMYSNVGLVRHERGLREALLRIGELETSIQNPSDELRNLLVVGRLVAEAALARTESRGSHFRSDNPSADDALAKRSFTRLRNAG